MRLATRSAPGVDGYNLRYSAYSARALAISPFTSRASPINSCASCAALVGGKLRIRFNRSIAGMICFSFNAFFASANVSLANVSVSAGELIAVAPGATGSGAALAGVDVVKAGDFASAFGETFVPLGAPIFVDGTFSGMTIRMLRGSEPGPTRNAVARANFTERNPLRLSYVTSNAGTFLLPGWRRDSVRSRPSARSSVPVTLNSILSSVPDEGGEWRSYCTVVLNRIAISVSPLSDATSICSSTSAFAAVASIPQKSRNARIPRVRYRVAFATGCGRSSPCVIVDGLSVSCIAASSESAVGRPVFPCACLRNGGERGVFIKVTGSRTVFQFGDRVEHRRCINFLV